MTSFFYTLFLKFEKKPWLAFTIVFLLLMGMGFFASRLVYTEDITQLIPKSEQSEDLQDILETVNFSDKIIVNIQTEGSGTKQDLVNFAESFLDSIEDSPSIEKIQGKVPQKNILETYDFVHQNLPLFLKASDYAIIQKRLKKDNLENRLAAAYQSLTSPAGMLTKKFLLKDPLGFTNLGLEKLKSLQFSSGFTLYNDFLVTKNGKNLLLFLTPTEEAKSAQNSKKFVESLRSKLQVLNEKQQGVKATAVGTLLYSVANAEQIKQDIFLSLSIALSVLLVILIWFYRQFYVPFLLLLPTACGAITALFLLYLFQTELSLIALGIGSVLIGISLDYSLHILTHFRANANVQQLYKEVSKPVLTSSFTTATAFLCLGFIDSPALNDLGYFAAISVVATAFFALILLPQLYRPKAKSTAKVTILDKLSRYPLHKYKFLLLGIGALFFVALFYFQKVKFNSDLSKLNYQPGYLEKAEKNLDSISSRNGENLYLVSYAKSLNQALYKNNELFSELEMAKNNERILSFSSIGEVVISTDKQEERVQKWEGFWTQKNKENLSNALEKATEKFGFKTSSFDAFKNSLNKHYQFINLKKYSQVENLYLDEFIDSSATKNLYTILSTVKIKPDKIPAFRKDFQESGSLQIINRKTLNESFLGGLKQHFNRLVLYSILAVFIILLLAYRNLKISLLTMLPIAITWVIALGIMYFFDIEFNIFNIIISSFIFGLGIDYSIFITNGLLNDLETENKHLPTYKTSILLSVITTILGIGVLLFAKHPALHSVAAISVIGILTVSLVSFSIQPFLFGLLFKKHK